MGSTITPGTGLIGRLRRLPVLPAVLLAAVAFHAWSLMRFPAPFVDEAWYTSRAWALVQTGLPLGSLDRGQYELFGPQVVEVWGPVWIQSLALRAAGAPELWAMRLASLAAGLLLLGAVAAIARRLGGTRMAVLAVLLSAFSFPFLYSAHLARPDVYAAAFGFWSVALVLHSRPSSPWLGLLAGICVGLSFESHLYGAMYAPVAAALFVLRDGRQVLRRRDVWGYVAGGVFGGLYYAALHLWPSPAAYLSTMGLLSPAGHLPPLFNPSASNLWNALSSAVSLLFASYPLLLAAFAWAGLSAARRRSALDRPLLVLAASALASFILLVGSKTLLRAVLVSPVLELLLAGYLVQVPWREWTASLPGRVRAVLVAALCLGSLALMLVPVSGDLSATFARVEARVQPSVTAGAVIVGPQTYWLGLSDHEYYSWEALYYLQRYRPGLGLEGAMRMLAPAPQIVIVDGHLRRFVMSDAQWQAGGAGTPYISLEALDALLARRGRLLARIDGEYYGEIDLYALTWDEGVGFRQSGR